MSGEVVAQVGVFGFVVVISWWILLGYLVPSSAIDDTAAELRAQRDFNRLLSTMDRVTHEGHEIVPVESVVDGTVLARLCVHCDEQLPA